MHNQGATLNSEKFADTKTVSLLFESKLGEVDINFTFSSI